MMASFLWLTWRAKREPARPAALGRVSILKPLAGADEDLEANLESFAHLEGADYEVLLGVASLDDPAVPLARRFLLRHPTLHARLVLTDPGAALNPKVAQLLALQEAAVGEVFVISDSNVRVPPDYLMQLMGELARPGVGLVSSVLAGTGETTFAAAVENLFIATHVAPGVVSAARVAGRPISMGKSMAMRRVDLARTGGFEAVANLLAEDHALGRRFHACGMGVRVCLKPVENRNVTGKLTRTLNRHTRWAQIRRTMAPTGLFFEPLLMPALVVPLLAFLSPSRPLAWLALGSVVVQNPRRPALAQGPPGPGPAPEAVAPGASAQPDDGVVLGAGLVDPAGRVARPPAAHREGHAAPARRPPDPRPGPGPRPRLGRGRRPQAPPRPTVHSTPRAMSSAQGVPCITRSTSRWASPASR